MPLRVQVLESLNLTFANEGDITPRNMTVGETDDLYAGRRYTDGDIGWDWPTQSGYPTWTTSVSGVVTVSSSGTVTAVAAGTVTVTGTYTGGGATKSGTSATITVSAP